MADSNHDILSKCGICLSYYTEPRLLNCFHKFCTPCLNKLADGNATFSCPLCRSKILVPEVGVTGFKSYPINKKEQYSDKTQGDVKFCQICDEKRFATVKCLNCEDYLCKQCHEYHTKVKTLKEHTYEIVVNQPHTSRVHDSEKRDSEKIECNIHGKEHLLFCKPCNSEICEDCRTNAHKHHEVKTILLAASDERHLVIAATACLKARIPILDNTIELANIERDKHYKCSLLVKRNIRSHAAGLKDSFCRTVDWAMNENLEEVNQIQKTETKQLDTYIDQVTTDKLSLVSKLKTSDDIVQNCSDKDILRMSADLKRKLSESIDDDGKSIYLYNIEYESTTLSSKEIKTFVGNVNKTEKKEVKSFFRALPMPNLQLVKEFRWVSSFDVSAYSLLSTANESVWILQTSRESCCLYTKDGNRQKYYDNIELSRNARLLKKPDDTVLLWSDTSARIVSDTMEDDEANLFKVPFSNGIACCLMLNGNLLVYNVKEKTFVEVDENDCVQREIKNEKLSAMLTSVPLYAVQTTFSILIIAQNNKVVSINNMGSIINSFSCEYGSMRGICVDKYNNVFVSDYANGVLRLFSPEGVYMRNVLTINEPTQLTIDSCGNMWLCHQGDYPPAITIYSYL